MKITNIRPFPSYTAVCATLTREERTEIRSLLDKSSSAYDRLAKIKWREDFSDAEEAHWSAIRLTARDAENKAHALWRGHGLTDGPSRLVRGLVD